MVIHYKTDASGRLITICPNGKECLVAGGECIECQYYKLKDKKNKSLHCNFRRKGTKNG